MFDQHENASALMALPRRDILISILAKSANTHFK